MSKPKFKIGEKVICIDDRPKGNPNAAPLITYKKEYKVLNINLCKCGNTHYDVGLSIRVNNARHTKCHNCDALIPGATIHWCGEFRFEKAISESKEEQVSEFIQMEFTSKELVKQLISQN